MRNTLLSGAWRYMLGVPPFLWEGRIEKARNKVKESTRFMSPDHRRIHHHVVRVLPLTGKPVSAENVAQALEIPLERTKEILQELEEHLTFLVRNDEGRILWAYPVTVEKTPHAITFDSGEHLYAA